MLHPKVKNTVVLAALACWCIFQLSVSSAQEQEKEAFDYTSYGRRDPFVPLVGIEKKGGTGGVMSILTVNDISLEGILVNPDGTKSAIINGEIMREGQKIGRLKVESIGGNRVKVRLNDVNYEVELYNK